MTLWISKPLSNTRALFLPLPAGCAAGLPAAAAAAGSRHREHTASRPQRRDGDAIQCECDATVEAGFCRCRTVPHTCRCQLLPHILLEVSRSTAVEGHKPTGAPCPSACDVAHAKCLTWGALWGLLFLYLLLLLLLLLVCWRFLLGLLLLLACWCLLLLLLLVCRCLLLLLLLCSQCLLLCCCTTCLWCWEGCCCCLALLAVLQQQTDTACGGPHCHPQIFFKAHKPLTPTRHNSRRHTA